MPIDSVIHPIVRAVVFDRFFSAVSGGGALLAGTASAITACVRGASEAVFAGTEERAVHAAQRTRREAADARDFMSREVYAR
jgi:hypothetical protein